MKFFFVMFSCYTVKIGAVFLKTRRTIFEIASDLNVIFPSIVKSLIFYTLKTLLIFWFIRFPTRNFWKIVKKLQNINYRKWCHRHMQYAKNHAQIFLVYQCFDLIWSLQIKLLTLIWISKQTQDLLGLCLYLIWNTSRVLVLLTSLNNYLINSSINYTWLLIF